MLSSVSRVAAWRRAADPELERRRVEIAERRFGLQPVMLGLGKREPVLDRPGRPRAAGGGEDDGDEEEEGEAALHDKSSGRLPST